MLGSVCIVLLVVISLPLHAQQLTDERSIAETEEYGSLAFDPSGKKFYTAGSGNLIKIRDTATGELLGTIDEQESCYTWALAVSPDGKTIAAAHGYSGGDGSKVALFDVATGELRTSLVGHDHVTRSIQFHEPSNSIVTSGDDGTLRWWDSATGENLATHQTGGHSFTVMSDGKQLATMTKNNGLQIWDIEKRELIRQLKLVSKVPTEVVTISPDGNWIASSGGWDDTTICLWDAKSGELVARLDDGLGDCVDELAFSPDNQLIAAARLNGGVTLCDRNTGKLLSQKRGGVTGGLAFDPRGIYLAQVHGNSEGSSGVMLWRVGDVKQ